MRMDRRGVDRPSREVSSSRRESRRQPRAITIGPGDLCGVRDTDRDLELAFFVSGVGSTVGVLELGGG
ncbi:MAG: hypothetical protein AB7G37_20615 [Solirubrobacteraceae bacterium]